MKKLFFSLLVAGSLVACTSNETADAEDAADSTVNAIEERTDSLQSNVQENADSTKAQMERESDSLKNKVEDNLEKND